MTHIAKARKQRGAKLVVVDPYRTATAEQADLHMMVKPGTDGALACAVMQVLFAEGFADRAYMARYADDPQGLEAHLQTRGPDWAAPITGIAAEDIRHFARMIGQTARTFIRIGYGFTRSRNGAAQVHAVTSIATVAGSWQHVGGGTLYSCGAIYGLDKSLIEGKEALDPKTRLLDQSRLGPILTGDPKALKGRGPVKALFIQNTNPMVVAPESYKVRQGFAREDLFTCVHEQFMTETAAMADLVLPATSFLEHPDLYTAGGHTHLSVTKAVIDPVGESWCNHDVICALAKKLGAKHPAFEMDAWDLIDHTLRASGLPDAETVWRQKWLDLSLPFEKMHFLDGFAHPDGKYHFRADWQAVGLADVTDNLSLPEWPDHFAVLDEATPEKPFRLVTAPARNYLNSSFTETPTSQAQERHPSVKLHPDAARKLDIQSEDMVRLGSEKGQVTLKAEIFPGLQENTLIVESLWPNHAFKEGVGINALTSADPAGPAGGAVFHDTAVWVQKVSS